MPASLTQFFLKLCPGWIHRIFGEARTSKLGARTVPSALSAKREDSSIQGKLHMSWRAGLRLVSMGTQIFRTARSVRTGRPRSQRLLKCDRIEEQRIGR